MIVVHVAGHGHHDVLRMVRALVQVAKVTHAERRHGVPRAENRVTVRMRAPERLVMQLEHEVVRGVIHHADLLEDHLALEGQVRRAQRRPKDQVRDDIRRLWQVLIENASLERRVFSRGVRIERAAEHLERERNVLGRPIARALEHHVFEHVRHAHAFARLVNRGGTDPCPKCDRPHSRHGLREHGQSIR
jgi:hypothetical protein